MSINRDVNKFILFKKVKYLLNVCYKCTVRVVYLVAIFMNYKYKNYMPSCNKYSRLLFADFTNGTSFQCQTGKSFH